MNKPIARISPFEPGIADRVVTVAEAAVIGGVSPSTLKRRARAGDLRLLKLSPRRIGVRLSELHRWLEGCAGGAQ